MASTLLRTGQVAPTAAFAATAALIAAMPLKTCKDFRVTHTEVKKEAKKQAPKDIDDATMKYAKPKKPVVPQTGGGCFMDSEILQARAICCMKSAKGQASGVLVRFQWSGTEQTAVLTCHHVVPAKDAPDRDCRFWCPDSQKMVQTKLISSKLISSSKALDYALVAVEEHPDLPMPLEMTLPRRRVFAGCAIKAVGFARNMPLRCMYGVVTGTKRNKFYSTSSHEPGLSGAPLFVDGELVGIHTGYLESTDEASGTYIGAILSHLYKDPASPEDDEDSPSPE